MASHSRLSVLLALAGLVAGAAAVPLAPTVTLRNGVKMPLIAAGTWQYNDTEAEESVKNALQVGFRLVDTAWDYNNQVGVGRGVRASGVPRGEVFVETKVPGCGLSKVVSLLSCYRDTKSVLEKNLQLLGMDYVDLVIIHFPPLPSFAIRTCKPACGEIRDQWRALQEFYAAGKAKAIGVSNYCPSCFRCLDGPSGHAAIAPMVNQVQYHIGMGPDPSGFVSEAARRGIVLQAYSPLGNKPWHKGPDPDIMSGKFTTGLAQAHNRSTIAVALKWLVQHGVPTVTKSSSKAHLADDLDLWSWNLTDAEMKAADQYHASGSPSFACNFAEEEVVV